MASTDKLVREWLLKKFLTEEFNEYRHGLAENVRIVTVDMWWECSCYSEYTRDDSFIMRAQLEGGKANGSKVTFEWSYGTWAMFPDFIEELDEYRNNSCCYEEDLYEEDDW